jgi:cyclopropane-fatty-acyl-phospholipid synthase
MSIARIAAIAGERLPFPDAVSRLAIGRMVGRTSRRLADDPGATDPGFAAEMDGYPVALDVEAANAQHYEVPAAFFGLVLGPQRKYSCCLYDDGATSLAEAEEHALAATARHAGLADGQRILELGCGWGSLSLWMAARYPAARITAVSNSHSQRAYITGAAEKRGLANLDVVTADMNTFVPPGRFDRIVSVEMFEHMANWRALLARLRGALEPDGRVFLHVFSHEAVPYRFRVDNSADWIAQHFFTGGIMPSHGLIRQFGDLFAVEEAWRWSGRNYQRTADDWLANFDRNADAIGGIMRETYGADARLWQRRWRLFFLATSGLFGHGGGEPWGVSHYRLAPAAG